ncbi:hypothetical protein PIB30_092381 [Stylosanthes scabra]|uniref:RRM domain-containing protein n=1 Tax=Stylosanthes scabra TaxID=79078 RepID=A0ABU6SV78_9FABA|nr:hypothetical protein [Stylosanthes scabra]
MARVPTLLEEGIRERVGVGLYQDIFISRKKRRNSDGTFAFVRFCESGCMRNAIDRLNGVIWNGKRLFVAVSKYACDIGVRKHTLIQNHQKGANKINTMKWAPVKLNKDGENNNSGPR